MGEDGIFRARGKEAIGAEDANVERGRGDCARRQEKRGEKKVGQHGHDFPV